MIFKGLKFLIFSGIIAIFIIYYSDKKKSNNEQISSKVLKDNAAKNISYTINLKNAILKVEADSVQMQTLSLMKLQGVRANFKTLKGNETSINANICDLDISSKIAILHEKVSIVSNRGNLQTNDAVIDWGKNKIFGNSQVFGNFEKNDIKADGFVIQNNGKISLKNVKIKSKEMLGCKN